jgi:hypothetical protein
MQAAHSEGKREIWLRRVRRNTGTLPECQQKDALMKHTFYVQSSLEGVHA